jgi:O-antigen ligase
MPHPRWHLRFSLGILCLMLTLPFLNPHHYNPIPTFYQEWTAAALGLLAATLLLRRDVLARLEIPTIALAPLGIGALLLVQLASGRVELITQALIFLLFLLWTTLLVVLGRALREQLGMSELVKPLAFALLIGACLAAAQQGIQLSSLPTSYAFFFSRAGRGGTLAQANHLTNYLWLGLASAIYLCVQGHLSRNIFAVIALILITCASLTGSRSVLLHAAGFTLLTAWGSWRYRTPALRKSFRLALFLCAATLTLQFLFSYFEIGKAIGTSLSGERFYQEVSSTSQRLQLWRTGLAIFIDHPWLGAGVGQFPWQAYLLVGAQPDGSFIGGAEHAHNLFIDLLAEFGLFAPLIVMTLTLRWWLSFTRQNWTAEHGWLAAVLLVEAMHSQLEYPLWYAYFTAIAALALGIGSTAALRPKITRLSRPMMALIFLLGAMTLFNLFADYRKLEQSLNWQLQPEDNRPTWHKTLDTLSQLHGESLFGHYIDLVYAYQLPLDRDALREKILITERAIRFSPVDRSTYKLAYLLALDGQSAAARLALQRAQATHPQLQAESIRQLMELSKTYAELKPLLEQLEAAKPQR